MAPVTRLKKKDAGARRSRSLSPPAGVDTDDRESGAGSDVESVAESIVSMDRPSYAEVLAAKSPERIQGNVVVATADTPSHRSEVSINLTPSPAPQALSNMRQTKSQQSSPTRKTLHSNLKKGPPTNTPEQTTPKSVSWAERSPSPAPDPRNTYQDTNAATQHHSSNTTSTNKSSSDRRAPQQTLFPVNFMPSFGTQVTFRSVRMVRDTLYRDYGYHPECRMGRGSRRVSVFFQDVSHAERYPDFAWHQCGLKRVRAAPAATWQRFIQGIPVDVSEQELLLILRPQGVDHCRRVQVRDRDGRFISIKKVAIYFRNTPPRSVNVDWLGPRDVREFSGGRPKARTQAGARRDPPSRLSAPLPQATVLSNRGPPPSQPVGEPKPAPPPPSTPSPPVRFINRHTDNTGPAAMRAHQRHAEIKRFFRTGLPNTHSNTERQPQQQKTNTPAVTEEKRTKAPTPKVTSRAKETSTHTTTSAGKNNISILPQHSKEHTPSPPLRRSEHPSWSALEKFVQDSRAVQQQITDAVVALRMVLETYRILPTAKDRMVDVREMQQTCENGMQMVMVVLNMLTLIAETDLGSQRLSDVADLGDRGQAPAV